MTTAALTLFCVAQDRRARSAEESFSFTSIRHIGPKTSVKLRSEASCPQSKRPWISPQLQIALTELHLILRLTADDEIVFQQWDEILRMIATIKLKEVTASDLFRRLNSYSKRHAPYRALEAFGQVPKSLFILQVTDDPVLRQAIEKQMDRIEHVHRLHARRLGGQPARVPTGGKRRPGDGGSLQAAHQELHHLLELSLPFAEVRRDQGYRQPGGVSRRGGPWLGGCLAAPQPARRV